MDCKTIMAILLDKRTDIAPDVQEVLTDYGCIINSRLGLHSVNECADEGLIILHLCGEEEQISELEAKLNGFERVAVNRMKIGFSD
ncbi:MAG: hypothetical protein ACOCZM_03500 [Bacillota bacterium]